MPDYRSKSKKQSLTHSLPNPPLMRSRRSTGAVKSYSNRARCRGANLKIHGIDEPIKGRVSLVSPALDPGSTTIEVWAEAIKPNPALKPGMTVEVTMTAKTVKEALVVPTPAVFKNNEGADYVVIAASDGHARLKTVQIGVRDAEFSQVLSGVTVGDPVISLGGYALPDNTQIKIDNPDV